VSKSSLIMRQSVVVRNLRHQPWYHFMYPSSCDVFHPGFILSYSAMHIDAASRFHAIAIRCVSDFG
jgi:hypothetical protein